ncbi:exonuclease domain-containing protein [Thalassobacillus pellis]|uniref:exonuclease domain-containing protein n=1 Tax=Thalassobacillus pellis TaxID=748008 RepID=UPI0019604B89|nr:exonuclease domain-containing protein [Thalassobacillus pellis]MBM7553252.1 DNA polymerase-3 subunit epsilon [Thalassobacillus pellis]
MDFVALDFETANSYRGSVCSIGIVEYRNSRPEKEYYRLVKPKRNYFAPMNINVHGITKEHVVDAREFDALWAEEIRELLEGKFVVAHNAQFDMGVLRATLDTYNIAYPMLAYNCTVNIAKKTWPLPRYNLKAVANHVGFRFNHHHALEDAKAAGHILLRAGEELNAGNVKELVEKTQTINGMMFDTGYEPARLNKKKRAKRAEAKSFIAATSEFDRSHPFYGASFVFTGKLDGMKREEAIQRVVDLGGEWQSTLEAETNYVVVGNQAYENYQNGKKSSKLERAETLMSQGHSIEIISEKEFLQHVKSSF